MKVSRRGRYATGMPSWRTVPGLLQSHEATGRGMAPTPAAEEVEALARRGHLAELTVTKSR